MTISRRLSVGTRHCLTYSTKVGPFIGPSRTNGATIRSWRRPATKVMVFQCPYGAYPTSRMPRAQRPRNRTILVLVAVSSIKTSRAGSSKPCSRIQRRRARATSARCCSAAYRLFLKLILWRRKKRPTALRLPGIPAAFLATTTSSNVISGCAAISFKNHFAYLSNRDTLPPLGFAAALPVSRQRRTQLMTELGLTSKCSATSRREAPDLTSSIARSRKSPEYGFGIEFSPANQTAVGRIVHCSTVGNPLRFDHTGIRSRSLAHALNDRPARGGRRERTGGLPTRHSWRT